MFNYPLTLSFKIIAFNPQVKITDAAGQTDPATRPSR